MIPQPYKPDAKHPDVDKLFSHLPDTEKDWLLSALGYGLKGQPSRRLYILLGEGGQGKSTLLNAIRAALGSEYGDAIPEGALTLGKSASAGLAPELLFAHHSRIATLSELDKSSLNERLLKNISGGDFISGRAPHDRAFSDRRSVSTMLIAANPATFPRLNFNDQALYDRVRILRYPKPPVIDIGLVDRLKQPAQAQALLALLVKYAVNTTAPPDDVPSVASERQAAKLESLGEGGQWLLSAIIQDDNARLTTLELWKAALIAANAKMDADAVWGMNRDKIRNLAREIHNMPVTKGMGGNRGRGWYGFRLATAEEAQQPEPDVSAPVEDAVHTINDAPADDLARVDADQLRDQQPSR